MALLAAALLLFVAQLSFDRGDIATLVLPANKPAHNLIGWLGAHFAWLSFQAFGVTAYIVPLLLAAFGVAYLFNFLGYLRERSKWSLLWASMLLVSLTGLLHIMWDSGLTGNIHVKLGTHSAGGALGWLTYEYGLWMLGKVGAVIVYATLSVIGVLCLTNFRLGAWLQAWFDDEGAPELAPKGNQEEVELERRARALEKKKRELEQEVAKTVAGTSVASGPVLGQDLKPVPLPTVRDLSYPQAKPAKAKKTETADLAKQIEPPDEGEVITAAELKAASVDEVLGRKSEAKTEEGVAATNDDKPAEPKPEPQINISGITPTRPKVKRPKPITVASTPIIGNYQLPTAGFSPAPGHDGEADRVEGGIDGQRAAHAADARAVRHRGRAGRHHQRPDHHALRIASRARREAGKNHRALQQHRRRPQGRAHQHSRAGARQKLRRRRSAQPGQDQGHHARPARIGRMAQHQGAAFRSRWARTFTAIPSSPIWRKCRTCSSPAAPARANPFASTPSSRRCSTAFRPTNCAS